MTKYLILNVCFEIIILALKLIQQLGAYYPLILILLFVVGIGWSNRKKGIGAGTSYTLSEYWVTFTKSLSHLNNLWRYTKRVVVIYTDGVNFYSL